VDVRVYEKWKAGKARGGEELIGQVPTLRLLPTSAESLAHVPFRKVKLRCLEPMTERVLPLSKVLVTSNSATPITNSTNKLYRFISFTKVYSKHFQISSI
jgi:hypothetical protein